MTVSRTPEFSGLYIDACKNLFNKPNLNPFSLECVRELRSREIFAEVMDWVVNAQNCRFFIQRSSHGLIMNMCLFLFYGVLTHSEI